MQAQQKLTQFTFIHKVQYLQNVKQQRQSAHTLPQSPQAAKNQGKE